MKTLNDALNFAQSSALMAWDQRDAYSDPIDSFRTNVIDTLVEQRAEQFTDAALAAYKREIDRLFSADFAKVREQTQQIINRFKGLPGEFYMLKGLLCLDHAVDSKQVKKLYDLRMIATRMDEINAETVAAAKAAVAKAQEASNV